MKRFVYLSIFALIFTLSAFSLQAYAIDVFTIPQNISNNGGESRKPSIATDGARMLIVWQDISSGNGEILFSKSIDGGATFSAPINISNNSRDSIYPSIVTDGTNILIVWQDGSTGNDEILFSKSTDGGTTFSVPKNLSNDVINSSNPSITTDGTNILVTWHDASSGNEEIRFSKSTDGGTTFSVPKNISNNSGESLRPSITTDGTNILVTWYDNSSGHYEILFSKSTDGGTTFSVPKNISNVIEDSNDPIIITDGTNILVIWNDRPVINYEIFFSKSTDGGTTFSVPKNISNTVGLSVDPSITTDGTNILVTWRDHSSGNGEILFSKSIDGGATFSAPINISNNSGISVEPSIATNANYILVTWYDASSGNGEILFSKSTIDSDGDGIPNFIRSNIIVFQ